MKFKWLGSFSAFMMLVLAAPSLAGENPPVADSHSKMGSAFDQGPRHSAALLEGMGNVSMPVSAQNPLAQKFFMQGLAQLGSFWSYEAERSFRQAAALEPAFAMAYWGMAMANLVFQEGSEKRAKAFIEKAHDLKANDYETAWISAVWKLFQNGVPVNRESREMLVQTLQAMANRFPEDVEIKAFTALFIWENASFYGAKVDADIFEALANDVLKANPLHPGVHHYRLHFWSEVEQPVVALRSAELAPKAAPAVAHASHMPSHVYWPLGRYQETARLQEAASRIDHRQLQKSREAPYEFHNYYHNSQFLIAALSRVGDLPKSFEVATNLMRVPKHPEKNSNFGAGASMNLMALLDEHEAWPKALDLTHSFYLDYEGFSLVKLRKYRLLMLAAFYQNLDKAPALVRLTRDCLANARRDAENSFSGRRLARELERQDLIGRELEIYDALLNGQKQAALRLLPKFEADVANEKIYPYETDTESHHLDLLYSRLSQKESAVRGARMDANKNQNSVPSLARLVRTLYQSDFAKEAVQVFEKELRPRSESIDLEAPLMQAIRPVSTLARTPQDWRLPFLPLPPAEIPSNANLEKLGPLSWKPSLAPNTFAKEADGKPLLVVFYLGNQCLECSVQIASLKRELKRFQKLGISILAVSTDAAEQMEGVESPGFPVVGDESLKNFKAFGAYDDFEKLPLHGLFLIDGQGYTRWWNVSAEPFMDMKFLQNEAKRLLSFPPIDP